MSTHDGPAPCPVCEGRRWERVYDGIRDWEFGTPGTFAYVRCVGCRLVRLEPFPDLMLLKAAYPDDYVAHAAVEGRGLVYRCMDAVRQALARSRLRRLVPSGARVLDVGCGSGALLRQLLELGAAEAHGIDFSPTAVRLCREKGLAVTAGTFPEFASPGGYDAIFMINYIEHVQDPLRELERAAALLRPGGVLVGELPNFRSLDRMAFGRYWGGNHCPRHTYQYDPQTLGALLRRAGFTEIALRQDPNPGHLALSLQNWLQRRRDLAHNPALRFGRSRYLAPLILALVPLGVLQALVGLSGNMTFTARTAPAAATA